MHTTRQVWKDVEGFWKDVEGSHFGLVGLLCGLGRIGRIIAATSHMCACVRALACAHVRKHTHNPSNPSISIFINNLHLLVSFHYPSTPFHYPSRVGVIPVLGGAQ